MTRNGSAIRAKWLTVVFLGVFILTLNGCALNSDQAGANSKNENSESKEPSVVKEPIVLTETAKEVLQNLDARRAFALALDKEAITNGILKNGSQAIDYFVPYDIAKNNQNIDFREAYPKGWSHFDKIEALKFWEKAKKDIGFEKVTLDLLTFNGKQTLLIAQTIKANLEANLPGLTVVIVAQNFNDKLATSKKKQYALEYIGWVPDYPDPVTYLDLYVSTSGQNNSGYSNPKYDEIIRAAKCDIAMLDGQKRWEQLQEAERQLIEDDAIIIPIFQSGEAFLASTNMAGVKAHSFAGKFNYKDVEMVTANDPKAPLGNDEKKVITIMTQGDIQTLDVSLVSSSASFEVIANVMEGLVSLNQEDQVVPGVATKWEASADGKKYTFHLRGNAKWSNGDRVTAHDFVYAWQRLANPNTGSSYGFIIESAQIENYADVLSGVKPPSELGVVAKDDLTLEVTLENPVPFFVKLMSFASFFPLNQGVVEAKGESYGKDIKSTVYNGPFVLSQWDSGFGYAIEKNLSYWDRRAVKINGVSFRIVADPQRSVALFDSQKLDRCLLTSDAVDQYKTHPDFGTNLESSVYFLSFNVGLDGKGNQ